MSYFGPQQPAYGPLVGPPLATQEQIEDYRSAKRKNNVLIIVLVIIVIFLIAAIIAVFAIAFTPKTSTDTTDTTTETMDITFDVQNSGVNYGTELATSTTSAFLGVQSSVCTSVNNVVTTYSIDVCKANSMSAISGQTTGILVKMQITVVNPATQTDAQVLAGVGAKLVTVTAPLSIASSTIQKV